MRKAIKMLKKSHPEVIVAEFNFQSDFRDRTSSLESLMATVQSKGNTKVIVFYEKEQRKQLERLLAVFDVYAKRLLRPVQVWHHPRIGSQGPDFQSQQLFGRHDLPVHRHRNGLCSVAGKLSRSQFHVGLAVVCSVRRRRPVDQSANRQNPARFHRRETLRTILDL